MNISKLSPKLIIGILIAIIFGISLLFRIVLPYEQVFNGEWIKFTSIDAYFYQRIIDNTAYNFPHLMNFDPYLLYPGGKILTDIFFPYWLMAGIIWLVGLGSPTQHTIDVVSVFFPAIIAALTVIPVYFIGKALFNRWVGVIAAALTAVLPGEYLGRTILGLNDTPAIETLLTATFMAFVILAIKAARERELTFDHILRRDWAKCARPLVFSVFAGLFLGMYLISWTGALLFVFIFVLYLVIQFVNDHLRRQSVDYLGVIGVIPLLLALIIFFRFSLGSFYVISLTLALFIPVVMVVISRVMTYRKIKPFYYPVALVVIGGIAVAGFYLINPDMLRSMFSSFAIFAPSGSTATTTIEAQPFLAPAGSFNTLVAWGNFTTSFFIAPWWLIFGFFIAALCGLFYRYTIRGSANNSLLLFFCLCLVTVIIFAVKIRDPEYIIDVLAFPGLALISLSILIYLFIRKSGAKESYLRPIIWVLVILAAIMVVLLLSGHGHRYWALVLTAVLLVLLFIPGSGQKNWLLFLVWTLVMLALTLGQRRFAYYLVVNIALLSAYLSWQIIWLAGIRKMAVKPVETPIPVREGKAKAKKKESRRDRPGVAVYFIYAALAGVVLFFVVFFPNISKATEMTTPEEAPYAPSDAWMSSLLWMKDNTPDPFGDPDAYYRLYEAPPPGETFKYPASAYGVTSWWDYGYWITQIAHRLPSANPGQEPARILNVANLFLSDNESSLRALMEKMDSSYVIIDNLTTRSKFWAVITWAKQPQEKYYDIYYVPYQGQLQAVQFYHAAYYRTLAVRLYNFDGKAVTDVKPAVITYVDQVSDQGISYKQVTDAKEFTSYQEALDYLNSQESGNHLIVGVSPFVSPVPLEAVPDYQLIHSSEQGVSQQNVGFIPEVKIFEYTAP
jgi:oligosaccharyl transferase (archaeosortase A-associated)